MISYQPLPEEHRKRISAVIAAKPGGISHAARVFKCARQTIKAAVDGHGVHPWMAQRLAEQIAERDAAGKVP